jgi:hypothetical protein
LKVGLEQCIANRCYGTCVQRDSNLVFINLHEVIQPFFWHYTSSMAFVAEASYISNEKFSTVALKEGFDLDFAEDINNDSKSTHPPFASFASDLNEIVDSESICVCFVAASKTE